MSYNMGDYDVAVVGAGHAGVEAALSAARLGCKTVLFTISLDSIANMPCNPSIGGTAKGHLVREIDALGGEMGKAADACFIQSRMLNMGKGPAVHSLRVQADRTAYHIYMKKACENQQNLEIKQAEVTGIMVEQDAVGCRIVGLETFLGAKYNVKTVIIATGTYLNGLIHVGNRSYSSGPDSINPALLLSKSLQEAGIIIKRFKTGTPCRVHRRSIDFHLLEKQDGDDFIQPFSFERNYEGMENKVSCYIGYTNEETHQVIRENLHRSPLYGGKIEGIGPRYCPSIEDKVVRFADKIRHQIFIEPMGLDCEEFYLQGMSSSLPEDVQLAFLRTILGLQNVEIMRNAYAIEYDCIDSTQLLPTLEFKSIKGLFGAGQFNGTSGYEEAAAQGLICGINAAKLVNSDELLVLDRASSYIGTLIDDLVIKGCSDPYRMMTSRSEYRLLLRQDNADERLTAIGYKVGLISEERYADFCKKQSEISHEIARVSRETLAPSEKINAYLEEIGTSTIATGMKISDLLRRPQVSYSSLAPFDPNRIPLSFEVGQQVELKIKYEGYIARQFIQVNKMRKLEEKKLPDNMNYKEIYGLRLEAVEKLQRVMPLNIGQASRISGVSPADISLILIWLEQKQWRGK